MNVYRYLSVDDLIKNKLVISLYKNELGYICIKNENESYFSFTKDANIDAYYFVLVQKGYVSMKIDMINTTVRAGELLLLTPFSITNFKRPSNDFSAICLLVSRNLFERIPNYSRFHGLLHRIGANKLTFCLSSFEYIENTFLTFVSYINQQHTFQEGLTFVLLDFMLLQISDEVCKLKTDMPIHIERKDELLQHFFSLLITYHKEQHSIKFYADKLNISTTYLSRIIRETTQKTGYHYIAEKIFTSARHLLACTNYTIAEITNELNFSDQSAFGKFFKAKAGISPAQYRKQLGRNVS